ncbi:MAG: phosphate signaling complex protein PhoU [Gemmatimonadota bacterium]|nr:phosphate signaling complex protein PhoU [Gemmatimonadota bacterium]
MSKHLERDLDKLKKNLLRVGNLVEEATNKAITALMERRGDLAREVIEADDAIDDAEVGIEEDCLKVLALHQPVALDLRFVISVMKANNDLERMGDQAVNIAERAEFLAGEPPLYVPLDFARMTDVVRRMVHGSLDAHVNHDTGLAYQVCSMDDQVDDIHRQMYGVLQAEVREAPDRLERALQYLSASKDLERIADLATNIAEDAVFMVDGEVIRHGRSKYLTRRSPVDGG